MVSNLAKTLALVALASTANAAQWKIGVLADMHLQPKYRPDLDPRDYCCPSTSAKYPDRI